MCGIFAYLGNKVDQKRLLEYFIKISHRGPDNCKFMNIKNNLYLGFHRLMINGLDVQSDQPFYIKKCFLVCNGEIYNFTELKKEFSDYQTNSDCEIIIHLYKKYGIKKTLNMLDGVFAFILYDEEKDLIITSRDPIGIRPLFIGKNNGEFAFGSEAKCLMFCEHIEQFPPGSWWQSNQPDNINQYYNDTYISNIYNNKHSENLVCRDIRVLFTSAVNKRLMSERSVGCLLSGGLDSSIVTALVANNYPRGQLRTYSIGMNGSVDLYWAQKVAKYLGTEHHSICLTEQQFLDAIEKTIYQIESYCTTTVRASVGNYLVSLYIRDNTPDTVIYCGDVSDEIFGSYRGFTNAPNEKEFHKENVKMLNNIHYFDVLRSDRSISGAGLEARVPFADKDFIRYVMELNPKFKVFNKDVIEKDILRKAFMGLLPDDIMNRRKEAFSDGVSSKERSWFQVIRDYVDKKVSDEDFELLASKYDPAPYDKESLYYRMIYEKYYGNHKLVPYFWRHPFTTIVDPSARLLDCY